MAGNEEFIGLNLVYTGTEDSAMHNIIEASAGEQFANYQDSCDLQACYDARDLETQFMDPIDSEYDFFRFLRASTRGIANNQPR